MAIIKNGRLSSDFLYTYTPKLDNIKLMLKHGLRYSLNKEKLPYKTSEQHNFVVCFCDILPEQAGYHKSIYGNYGISFKKEWAIKNEISPIRYIHKKSTGATENYNHIKNDLRESRKALMDGNQIDYLLSLILHSTAREKGLLTKDSIDNEIDNEALLNYMSIIDKSHDDKRRKYGDSDLISIFNEWVIPILHMLEKTVDELERRDALLRIYQGDFRHVKNKILYDEREWRSVKFFTEAEKKVDPSISSYVKQNGCLPESFNLKFELQDISAILVETDIEKNEIQNFIKNEISYLHGVENLVITFAEHIKKA